MYTLYILCSAAGIDLQTQEAYELAAKGLIRAKSVGAESATVIYGMKCIEFDPPHFTLGMFCSMFYSLAKLSMNFKIIFYGLKLN